VLGAWRGQYSVRDIDHVCATVLSKIKILFFYLFYLLNREERDPTPLARIAGAVSAYAGTEPKVPKERGTREGD